MAEEKKDAPTDPPTSAPAVAATSSSEQAVTSSAEPKEPTTTQATTDPSTTATTSAPIAVDPEFEEGYQDDELEGEGSLLSTESLSDTIRNYRNLHGRTFGNSKTTEYWGPNDEKQNEGLDIVHHALLIYHDDKLFQAPIGENPQNVLDVGTGTGIWAIDFADQHPSARVIGTDISPIQPTWAPANCEFQIDDAQLDWTFPTNHFDFIHLRDLYGSIDNWGLLYKKAFAHLKPGGWFEDQEFDIQCHSDVVGNDAGHIYNVWNELFLDAGEKIGKTFKIGQGSRMKNYMAEAGFVNCVERKFRIPIGSWSRDMRLKEVGECIYLFINQSIEGFALFLLTQVMGWKYEECQVLIAKMMDAVRKYRKFHPYYEVTLVYGQKPESKSPEAA